MQLWQALQFAAALFVLISCIALIINKLHMIERAEFGQWKAQLKNRIQLTR